MVHVLSLLQVLAESEEQGGAETVRQLPVSPVVFGIAAMAVFAVLLAVTYAFRSVGHRH
jgi:hypothetical protein